jgi:hypothetical protein
MALIHARDAMNKTVNIQLTQLGADGFVSTSQKFGRDVAKYLPDALAVRYVR